MRTSIAMLAVLGAYGLSPVCADPPNAAATPESLTAAEPQNPGQSSKSETSAVPGSAPAAPAAAQGPSAAPTKPAKRVPDEQMQEQLLRYQGYKLTMVNGEAKYCRREKPMGSRIASLFRCVTVEEATAMAREGQQTTEKIQRQTFGCLLKADKGCGN